MCIRDRYLAFIIAPKIINIMKKIIAYLNFNIFDPMADPKTFAPSFAPTIIASVAINNISNII